MAYHMNRKAVRDAERIAEWRTYDDAQFAKIGISREQLEELLIDFLGEIILPWSSQYNAERRLYNPVFDPFPGDLHLQEPKRCSDDCQKIR